MKKGISQWAFAGKKLEECFKMAKAAGYDGVGAAIDNDGEINLKSKQADIDKVLASAEKAGVEVSSLATGLFWGTSLTSDDKGEREKAKDIVRKMLEVAAWLKVDTILVVPGAVDVIFDPSFPKVSYDLVWERSLEAMKELAPEAEEKQVAIGVENVWNKFLLTPLEMKNFVDEVGSDYVGTYFDVGNVIPYGYPEQWIRILGKRIKKVHFKDYKQSVGTLDGFVNLLYGSVNWPEVMAAFKDVGYDDWVTAELFPANHYPESIINETSLSMDKILGRQG